MKAGGPFKIITAGNMANTLTSTVIAIPDYSILLVQAVFTTSGSLGGTFKLQGSADHMQQLQGGNALVTNAGNWLDINGSSYAIAAAGSYYWNLYELGFPYIQLVYTHAGGDSGSLNAVAYIKQR